MDYVFLKSHYKKEIKLTDDLLDQISEYSTIGVFSSIQFVPHMQDIMEQLQEKFPDKNFITSNPSRANNKYQVLGCNVYGENFNFGKDNEGNLINPECYLYVGDGIFHPQAMVLAQKESDTLSPVLRFNPKNDAIKIFTENDIKGVLQKYRAGLLKFLDSENIGVYVTTKVGQQQYEFSKKIKEKFPKKNFYFFASETLNIQGLEDFPFVDLWINTACPRIALEDSSELETISKIKMINIDDAMRIQEILSKDCVLTRI